MAKSKKRRLSDKSKKQAKKQKVKPACLNYDDVNLKVDKTLFQTPKLSSASYWTWAIAKEIIIDQVKEPVWYTLTFVWHLFF
jgi:hypothetical protein